MWFSIIKNPKLRTSSKVTTNLGIDSKEEDNSCERKLREYANKLGNKTYVGELGNKSGSYVDEGIPEEVHCKTLKIINEALNLKEEFKSFNSFSDEVKEKNGIIWNIACDLYIARESLNDKLNVYFFLQVDTQHSPIPHPKYSEIYLYNETEYGEKFDDDNIDYAKIREIDFR